MQDVPIFLIHFVIIRWFGTIHKRQNLLLASADAFPLLLMMMLLMMMMRPAGITSAKMTIRFPRSPRSPLYAVRYTA